MNTPWDELNRAIDGHVHLRGSLAYGPLAPGFNAWFDHLQPEAIVRCASPEDAAETIRFVTRLRLEHATRSGGHCFAGHSTRGVLIDVGELRAVSISGGTVRVGAGAPLGRLHEQLDSHGVTVVAGSCPEVGIAGFVLGGGLGILGRIHGVASDQLIAAQIVLADGRIIDCDDHQHPDLFWALRGAGVAGYWRGRRHRVRPLRVVRGRAETRSDCCSSRTRGCDERRGRRFLFDAPVIVKHNLSPLCMVSTDRVPLAYATAVAVVVTAAHERFDVAHLAVPFAPVGTLGAAVAIFTAFRINAANARWTEARAQWATIQNSCRVLTRQLVAATTNSVATGAAAPEAAASYRREMAGRMVAFSYSLAARLRGTNQLVVDRAWADDFGVPAHATNPANLQLQTIAVHVKDGVRDGLVGQFDPITLEPALGALNGAATACERLKHTPTPRQYDYFTRVAVAVFSTLLPFGLVGALAPTESWWAVPLTVVIAGVFIVLENWAEAYYGTNYPGWSASKRSTTWATCSMPTSRCPCK
jgi:predicted membrane chloride channel (bestrophin family)